MQHVLVGTVAAQRANHRELLLAFMVVAGLLDSQT